MVMTMEYSVIRMLAGRAKLLIYLVFQPSYFCLSRQNCSLCGEIVKGVNQGNDMELFKGEVSSLIGFVWTIKNIPFDFSYVLSPDSEDYNYSLGITMSF